MSTFTRAQFQEAAVEHIVQRLTDPRGSRRMLLADEVGLGKTVVARGVIEKFLKRRKSLTVIYLCSNAEIAEQNRQKLNPNSRKPVGRVTELALERDGEAPGLLLYSFTPGTSLKDGTGLEWERRLLLYLLFRIYRFPVWRHAWREFFRCGVTVDHWAKKVRKARLRSDFKRKVSTSLQDALAAAWRHERWDGQDLVTATAHAVRDFKSSDEASRRGRNQLVARLRGAMQRVVLRHLEPDLLVLDEVQRFREVLEESENPEHIAAELFTRRTPVLILSATPYRALTLGHELADGGSSHHEDFFSTLRFLFDRDTVTPQRIQVGLKTLGDRLQRPEVIAELDPALLELKRSLEDDLRMVMCRTERNWYVLDRRKGVEDVGENSGALPGREELEEFFRLHRSLSTYAGAQVTEFWKSAPSLLTFLDLKYSLLRKLRDERVRVPRGLLSRADDVTALARRNHRIGRVVAVALGNDDTPPRLWAAPTYTYYRDELYGDKRPRKLLVFSGWRFVPKAVAIVASRVAVERMGGEITEPTQPLRFSERRSFHTFDVCFPSPLLARVGAEAYREVLHGSPNAQAADTVSAATRCLRSHLQELGVEIVPHGGDPTWRVVLGAERADGRASQISAGLDAWASGDHDGAPEAVAQHREWAVEWLSEKSRLRLTETRLERLALIATFSPANCLLRALESVYGAQEVIEAFGGIVRLCLGSLRRYFNRPHVQQLIRGHRARMPWRHTAADADRGYAERVLIYAADAHLQAVLDEYVYLVRHASQAATVEKALERLDAVWSLVPGKPRANGARGRGNLVTIETDAEPHVSHFALAFGEDAWRGAELDAEEGEKLRKSAVREAFNSPFWPFVLATTSVGQEGLDFHLYCRDVLHWNLPSNPVDLEQREGRVNRRDGLALRQSIARDWGVSEPRTWGNSESGRNPWPVVFDSISSSSDEQKYKHGLFPHWIYECRNPAETIRIQRHVPVFSTSRDAAKYERLKTGLALYRLVFGQADQEVLLDSLHKRIQQMPPQEQERALRRLSSYMLNLSPIGHEQALRHAQEEAEALLSAPSHEIEKLLDDVERIRADQKTDLSSVADAIDGLIAYVRHATGTAPTHSTSLRTAVAALAYLRNPYDRIFDLHVEGGFADDAMVVKDAWSSLNAGEPLFDVKPASATPLRAGS